MLSRTNRLKTLISALSGRFLVINRLDFNLFYVLSLHLELDSVQKRHIVITGTLAVVIFTIVILGGLTYGKDEKFRQNWSKMSRKGEKRV